jgi:hypothetical protein
MSFNVWSDNIPGLAELYESADIHDAQGVNLLFNAMLHEFLAVPLATQIAMINRYCLKTTDSKYSLAGLDFKKEGE